MRVYQRATGPTWEFGYRISPATISWPHQFPEQLGCVSQSRAYSPLASETRQSIEYHSNKILQTIYLFFKYLVNGLGRRSAVVQGHLTSRAVGRNRLP